MTTKELIKHFGSVKDTAFALDVDSVTVRSWGDYPPKGRQFQAQVITSGRLKVEPDLIPAWISIEDA